MTNRHSSVNNASSAAQSQTFKDALQYSLATVFSVGFGLVRSVALPFVFGPLQMGVWNLMNVVISYGANAHLGILHGMNKLIPLLRGQKRFEEINVIRDSVFSLNLVLAGVCFLMIFIGSFFAPREYLFYLWIAAGIIFLQLLFAFQFSILRANSAFFLVSRGIGILAVCSTVFVLTFALLSSDRVLGALLGLAAAYSCIVYYWFFKSEGRLSWRLSVPSLRQAFMVGVPISLIGVLDAVFISMDRWIIAANFGVTALGYYALGIMVNNLISIVPSAVSSVFYPKMIERFSVGQDFSSSNGLLLGALRISAIGMLVLICSVSLFLPLIIQFFLPKYLPSVPIIKILVSGAFFFSLSYIAANYLIAVDKQRWIIIVQAVFIAALVLFYGLVLRSGGGILVLSRVTAAGYSLLGLSQIFLAVYLVNERKCWGTVRFMAGLAIPFVLMVILDIVAERFLAADRVSISSLRSLGLSFLLIMGIVLPVAWVFNRDSALERVIKEEWKRLWRIPLKRDF